MRGPAGRRSLLRRPAVVQPPTIARCLTRMLRAADERYRVYTVEEFLGGCLEEQAAPPSSTESAHGSRGARRREWGRRVLGATMLLASVGTVAGLVGANLLRQTASSRRGRTARASIGSPARPAESGSAVSLRHERRARRASAMATDHRAVRRTTPTAIARMRRLRVRRSRSYALSTSHVGRDVAAPVISARPRSHGARPLLTAAATVAEPRRSSAEFGFER